MAGICAILALFLDSGFWTQIWAHLVVALVWALYQLQL